MVVVAVNLFMLGVFLVRWGLRGMWKRHHITLLRAGVQHFTRREFIGSAAVRAASVDVIVGLVAIGAGVALLNRDGLLLYQIVCIGSATAVFLIFTLPTHE